MMKKMKVLYIITGLNTGGVEMMMQRAIAETSGEVESVVVSLMGLGTLGGALRESGVKVYTLDLKKNPLCLFRLYGIISAEKPDAIQCKMYHANLLGGVFGRLAGCKKIFWGIHHTSLAGEKFTTKLTDKLCAFLARFCCEKVVCCGIVARNICRKNGYPAERLVIIPNGYDTQKLSPDGEVRARMRKALGLSDSTIAVCHVGRYNKVKNHVGIVRSFAEFRRTHPDSELIFVGAGVDTAEDVAAEISALGLGGSVRALGLRRDVGDILNAADFTVLFSFSEAFPNVLAESMLCGKLAVSSDAGDARFIVGDDNFIVPIGDEKALAEKMREIADMPPQRREELGAKARESVIARFSLKSVCRRYIEMWRA